MGLKTWIINKLVNLNVNINDATGRDLSASVVKKIGLRNGDLTNKDFEDPEFDLNQITAGYNADSYIRQGVDKYVDQLFKEGYDLYSKNDNALEYIKLRLSFIAESTKNPTQLFLIDIAEDVVKYGNCFVAKSRANDPNMLPPGVSITGLMDMDPIGGYFCLNATTIKTKRDKNGIVKGYQQETDDSDKPVKIKAEDMIHFPYKREKGNSFGTPFLWPVLDDVRSLRQAEENVLRMMYRNIHPFNHVQVGTDDYPADDEEIESVQESVEGMEIEGGLATSHRVNIKPIASDQVINAEPYLRYLEERIFSGMGIPAILFGRGDTANRSTGDNMTSDMADRIKAIQRTIEATFNEFIIKELLMEGGFDPILNPDDMVEFRFKENQMDSMIKFENHVVFKFENNLITEDEARLLMNMDPIQDRSLLHRELTMQSQIQLSNATNKDTASSSNNSSKTGASKNVVNKNKPTNQYGQKSSPKKTSDSINKYSLIDKILKMEK